MTHPKQKIWPIKGGVHPPFNKECSTQQPIIKSTIPAVLTVPVLQHIGELGHILVEEGQQIFKGQPLTDLPEGLGAITHAPTSGKITAIEERDVPHVSGLTAICVVIECDGKDDWGDYHPIGYTDYVNTDRMYLCERLRTSGLVGMGGAAFPSAAKLAASDKHGIKTLIINGAECEPYITCDDMLMRSNADEIIEGIKILLHILNPQRCLIGIEDNKPEAIAAMEKAVENNHDPRIQVVAIPTIYPSGDEKQLIKILTGQAIPKKALPFDYDILLHNVATVHSVYRAIVEGRPLISRLVTVTGRGVSQPKNFNTLIGTPFSHLVEQAGDYTDQAERLIMGGPMMGYPMKTDQLPIVKATNCILVAPKEDLPYSCDIAMPCIRCGKCMEACPVDLLPQQLYWYAKSSDLEKIQKYRLMDCIECGCCSYVCPSQIPLVAYFRYAKSEIREEQHKQLKMDRSRERHEFREFRKQREKEEREAKRAQHKAKLQAKKAGGDDKQAAIKAAMERAKQKKAARAADADAVQPRNTENLTTAQQAQIEEAEQRRAKQREQAPREGDS